VIGYPSGQDGAILPARDTGYVPQGTFIMLWCFIPYNKSFIEQACSVKMAGYWPRSFFCVFMDRDEFTKVIEPLTTSWVGMTASNSHNPPGFR